MTSPAMAPARRRRRSPLPGMLLTTAVVAAAGAWGVVRAADARIDDVERVDGLEGVLADDPGEGFPGVDLDGDGVIDPGTATYPAVNYLLVGSDSREGISGDDGDLAFTGDSSAVGGRRSDTIMILRQEENGGAALLSLPRDLWVEIAGTGKSQRINTAYNDGPERLAATVSQTLGIPVHHYVEVDFVGFKDIIDEIGGVEVCVAAPARDTKSGLHLDAGCQTLDGLMALAYARSRTYQEWNGSDWATDGRGDLGRIERQQLFMRAAVDGALAEMQSSPFGAGDLVGAVVDSVRIDQRLDPIDAAQTLRSAAQVGVRTFAIPVVNDTVGTASVLRLGDGAESVFDYFRGAGPPPVQFETTTATAGNA